MTKSVGLVRLIRELELPIELPAVRSEAGSVARRTVERPGETLEIYPAKYACQGIQDNLRFALRYEPIDLRVWHAVMQAVSPDVLTRWVSEQPSSAYSRRAWYLYERTTGKQLPLRDSAAGFVDLANHERQMVWSSERSRPPYSKRHRVRNNLLGSGGYCPLIRRTQVLDSFGKRNFSRMATALTHDVDPMLLRRAADFLYRSETRSSYAIEGEEPAPGREERFIRVLERAGSEDIASEAALTDLQNSIVQDARFAASGWRTTQNYVGRTRRFDYSEDVRYVCPRPQDLPELMNLWMDLLARAGRADLDDVVPLAACVAFSFVYLHPFEDGNGRLHRFLIHHILAKSGYTPEGVIFPVSSVIQRRMKDYETVLETVSRLINPLVKYQLGAGNVLTVLNETADFYRYPDLTPHTEFLYECIEETLEKDWPQELSFLKLFDGASRDVRDVVELPDNRLRLLVRLLLQNNGSLSQAKRHLFAELRSEEVSRIEFAVRKRMEEQRPAGGE